MSALGQRPQALLERCQRVGARVGERAAGAVRMRGVDGEDEGHAGMETGERRFIGVSAAPMHARTTMRVPSAIPATHHGE